MIDLPTIILRHRKENLAKCSLRGLEPRKDLQFYTYPVDPLPEMKSYIILSLEGEELSYADREHGLFLIDGTWNYAEVMYQKSVAGRNFIYRTLPKNIYTAYPRKQTGCKDPERGLASVEALYVAYLILGKDPSGLLDHYYWKKPFLAQPTLKSLSRSELLQTQ
jgi:pre-rRNA-processing protein TSR3